MGIDTEKVMPSGNFAAAVVQIISGNDAKKIP